MVNVAGDLPPKHSHPHTRPLWRARLRALTRPARATWPSARGLPPQKEQESRFKRLDTNHDGKLSADEFHEEGMAAGDASTDEEKKQHAEHIAAQMKVRVQPRESCACATLRDDTSSAMSLLF